MRRRTLIAGTLGLALAGTRPSRYAVRLGLVVAAERTQVFTVKRPRFSPHSRPALQGYRSAGTARNTH